MCMQFRDGLFIRCCNDVHCFCSIMGSFCNSRSGYFIRLLVFLLRGDFVQFNQVSQVRDDEMLKQKFVA